MISLMKLTPIERFWMKVDKDGPIPKLQPSLGQCWLWIGGYNNKGYPTFYYEGSPVYAHRFAWFLKTGRWPKNNSLHKCDTPLCIRWSHLFDGTHKENTQDMIRKGRARYVGLLGSRNGASKLTEDKVREIKELLSSGETQRAIAKGYGVTQALINYINVGRNWRHV